MQLWIELLLGYFHSQVTFEQMRKMFQGGPVTIYKYKQIAFDQFSQCNQTIQLSFSYLQANLD